MELGISFHQFLPQTCSWTCMLIPKNNSSYLTFGHLHLSYLLLKLNMSENMPFSSDGIEHAGFASRRILSSKDNLSQVEAKMEPRSLASLRSLQETPRNFWGSLEFFRRKMENIWNRAYTLEPEGAEFKSSQFYMLSVWLEASWLLLES